VPEERKIKTFSVHEQISLKNPRYVPLQRLVRTLHFNDFARTSQIGQFAASKVDGKYKTRLPRKGHYVFFRAESDKDNNKVRNDFYGNIGLSLDVMEMMKTDRKIKLFDVDCAFFCASSASRILVTRRKSFENCPKLSLDKLQEGNPIIRKGDEIYFADRQSGPKRRTMSGKLRTKRYRHSVEFVFDLDTIDSEWLFKQCKTFAVDHSRANQMDETGRLGKHQCLIYNTMKKECPSPWTVEEAMAKLNI